jgi:glycosyltransferase involved in cell wall biosynthesis
LSVKDENIKHEMLLVFTQGVGLRTWFDAGFASREIDYYRDIADALGGVSFLTYDKSDPLEIDALPDLAQIRVEHNDRSLDRRFFSLLAPLLKYRSFRSVDVIKTTQHRGAWTALLLKWLLRKPMLARCGYIWSLFEQRAGASNLRNRMIRFLEGFVLRRADAIAVPDEFSVDYLSKLHGISEAKFTVLPNFVDTEQFVPGEESARSKSKFLFIGRLESDQKRPMLAVRGAAQVTEGTLDIVGDGPELEEITQVADGIDNVQLLGRLSHFEISKMMGSALGLIIPSRYEGNPKVVIEALSAGLPVIATKSQGLTEIVEDGVNGLLVDPDPESIAQAMRTFMDDPGLWLEMSKNARKIALAKYSRASVLDREISLLTRLIKTGS